MQQTMYSLTSSSPAIAAVAHHSLRQSCLSQPCPQSGPTAQYEQSNSVSAVIMLSTVLLCTDMQQTVYTITSSSPAFAAFVSGASGSPPPSVDLAAAGGVGSCPIWSGAGTGLQLSLPPTVAGHPQLTACTLGRCPGIAQPTALEGASPQAAGRDE